jgi:hypothetical protein
LLLAVETLEIVLAEPATSKVKSAKLERLDDAKLQPLLTPRVTDVAPTVGF